MQCARVSGLWLPLLIGDSTFLIGLKQPRRPSTSQTPWCSRHCFVLGQDNSSLSLPFRPLYIQDQLRPVCQLQLLVPTSGQSQPSPTAQHSLAGRLLSHLLISFTLAEKFSLVVVPDCTPLRRSSWSAPPGLVLDRCLAKVNLLSRQGDRLRSLSVPDLVRDNEEYSVVGEIVDQLLYKVVEEGECNMVQPRQCHHCHRPLNHPENIGNGSGVDRCTLDHFDLCPGGRKTSPDWTGCPEITTDMDSDEERETEPTGTDINGGGTNHGTVPPKNIPHGDLVDNGLGVPGETAALTKLDPQTLKESCLLQVRQTRCSLTKKMLLKLMMRRMGFFSLK